MLTRTCISFFSYNLYPTTEYPTLSLHDALPISLHPRQQPPGSDLDDCDRRHLHRLGCHGSERSEEHTSELQSPCNLVCHLLLEKKKSISKYRMTKRLSNTKRELASLLTAHMEIC